MCVHKKYNMFFWQKGKKEKLMSTKSNVLALKKNILEYICKNDGIVREFIYTVLENLCIL